MAKKFDCMRKFQDREFREKIAKNAFNAHRKFTGCDSNPMTIEETASMVSLAIVSFHLVKLIVKMAKESK